MSEFDHVYAVIMAGGGGIRLWPLSRQSRPKQMVRLLNDRTLFQLAVDRIKDLLPYKQIYVVTGQDQAGELSNQYPEIPAENFLMEPSPKNTATVVGYAAAVLSSQDPAARMIVLTADHFIENIALFHKLLRAGLRVAENGFLVTLGIDPVYPTSGYGYIQQGPALPTNNDIDVFQVKQFIEKPPREQAEQFLAVGGYTWNSGMFLWNVDRILDEIRKHMPDLAWRMERLANAWADPVKRSQVIAEIWPDIEPQPIDRGVMEKASRVAVLPATGLGWSDVGNWDSFFELLDLDPDGNLVMNGKARLLDTQDSMIYGQSGKRLVALIGVEDLVIVDTPDALLICDRRQVQKVRQMVELLRQNGETDYL